jgi:hypothetical protein
MWTVTVVWRGMQAFFGVFVDNRWDGHGRSFISRGGVERLAAWGRTFHAPTDFASPGGAALETCANRSKLIDIIWLWGATLRNRENLRESFGWLLGGGRGSWMPERSFLLAWEGVCEGVQKRYFLTAMAIKASEKKIVSAKVTAT